MAAGRWVLHVDLDAFLASVEVLRRPQLKGLPVVVGGDGDPTKRGVVATASYEARAFGVRSGLPLRTAARRCPDAVFLPVDRPAYEQASAQVMAEVRETVSNSVKAVVEVVGWDEAFVGVVSDEPETVARDLQQRVVRRTRLSCSVGIGKNKLHAKTATAFGKPAGVYRLEASAWLPLLGDRPPDAIWGIGPKTARRLAGLGVHTVNDLARADPAMLAASFGPTTGPWLVRQGAGQDDSPVVDARPHPRSRSREQTFQSDVSDADVLARAVQTLAHTVAADARAEDRPVVRVVVKVRDRTFYTRTHGRRLQEPTRDAARLAEVARAALQDLLGPEGGWRPIRLVGVRGELAD